MFNMFNICAPSIVYLMFSITQILIDFYNQTYNNIIPKIMVTIMVSLLLNILCERNLNFIAWMIVFIPFFLMTVLVGIIIYIFGIDSVTGNSNYKCDNLNDEIKTDKYGNIIIYDPEYKKKHAPAYYRYPNIIVPNPSANDNLIHKNSINIPYYSSSPAYQS